MSDADTPPLSTPPPAPQTPRGRKDDALRRLGALKNGVTLASIAGFIALSGFIAAGRTGSKTPSSATGATRVAPTATPTPNQGQGQDQYQNGAPQGGFFDQSQSQGQGQGGYSFGGGSSTQAPMAGSGAS